MMEHQTGEPLSFAALALALANDYSRLFVIDSESGSYIEYTPNGTEKELVQVSGGTNFFEDVRRNVRAQVWPDDQESFLNAFQREAVLEALENGRSFSLTYRLNTGGTPRYYALKTIRSDDRSIIIGVRDVDAEKRRELKAEAASLTYSGIAQSLASLFEVIYHIDIETGSYTEYSASESYAKLGFGRSGEDFFSRARADLQLVVHPEDCARIMHGLERDVLLEALRSSGTVSMTYRQILDDKTQYVRLLAFMQQGDTAHIVIAVRNVDAQVKQEAESEAYSHIADALASRYEVIYYISLDTNAYSLYSASTEYDELGLYEPGDDFFRAAEVNTRQVIHPDDVQYFAEHLNKDYITEKLRQEGAFSIAYRQMLDGRYQYMNMVIVSPKNDPHHIIIGVFNTDAQMRREISIKEESRTFSDIAMALAQRYEVIYHVNIATNEYAEYTASEKYARLKVGAKGKDFFAETQENMKKDIYPEDLPMMSLSMQKDNLLNSLASFGKTILNYRLMLDGRPQYVSLYAVRPKEDSEHIIVAVANVDAAKRMEQAYHMAIDMANKDALTGVKNKRAYVQAEVELDELIEKRTNPAFAIVVCDLNGLKHTNDTQGHKAGDDYIRSACVIICNTFKHSPVFRIGGDEFAVILKGQDYEKRAELMQQLHEDMEARRHGSVLILASGISEFDPEKDLRVQDVFERADNRMYADKEICKAESGMECR